MRSKEFDPDVALSRAMDLFWSRGYEATGVADLVEHLGIARASLYATFGSKEQLFRRAIERYLETQAGPVIAELGEPGPVLPRLEAMLLRLADVATNDPHRRGCFVVNAAMERLPADLALGDRVAAHLRADVTAIAAALTRARASGELSSNADPLPLARFLVTTIQGLRVVGKGTADPDLLRDTVTVAMAALPRPEGSA